MDWETIVGSGGGLTISFQNNLIIASYHFLFSHSVHWDIDLEMEIGGANGGWSSVLCVKGLGGGLGVGKFYWHILEIWSLDSIARCDVI